MKRSRFQTLRLVTLVLVSLVVTAALSAAAEAAIRLDPVLSGLSSPVYVTSAHDGTNRLFVVEQTGTIRVMASGASATTLFLDITSKVLYGGERGLLGLAFHPQFANNRRFFVDYTRQTDGATVIAEYTAFADPAQTAASERVFLVIAQPFANHNGGMVEFGSDGFLYVGMGDGGDANDPGRRAQNIDELLGKILRIDVDHPSGPNLYSSPAGNPFAGSTPGRDEIYAVGMRNPFRFSFDRQTGQLYVGDVGQSALEEIDIVTVGGNYGWRVYEGNQCTQLDPQLCNPANFAFPIAQYDHSGGRCSIIGGYVYRGASGALPQGTYVFGDYCSGEVFSLVNNAPNVLLDTSLNISSFGEDEAGELYVASLGGTVYRIANAASSVTMLGSAPNPAAAGNTVTFTATVNGTNPTGTVNFTENGSSLPNCGTVALTGAGNTRTATCSIASLAVGTHPIVANYSGDAANTPSMSSALSQVINPPVTTSASFVGSDTTTKGNWHGVYGSQGYSIINDTSSLPSYAQLTPTGQSSYTWVDHPDSDSRAPQRGVASGRIAACWFASSSFNVDVNLTAQGTHRVAFYLLDWDNISRVTQIDVLDANTQQVLSTRTLSGYSQGVYMTWDLSGHVIVRFTTVGGQNSVLSAVFFDAAVPSFALSGTVTLNGSGLSGVSFSAPSGGSCSNSNASGQYTCTVPQGWSGTVMPALTGYTFTPPSRSYSNVAANQTAQDYTATAPVGNGSASFVGSDTTTKGNWHGVYGSQGYSIINDTSSLPSYAQLTPSGQSSYTWVDHPDSDPRATQRGVASGRIAACWFASSSFNVDLNLTDQGTHRVAFYLLDWDNISRVTQIDVLDATTQQVLSTRTLSGYSQGVYMTWDLSGHVTVRFTTVGGQNSVLSAIFFDSAVPTFQLSGAVTLNGSGLSGVSFSAPSGGSCVNSNASGQYTCAVPQGWSGTVTPALTGYTFTPPSRSYSNVAANQTAQDYTATAPVGNGSATFVSSDTTTKGNWHGVYGSQGYSIINDSSSLPSYAQLTPSGQSSYTWVDHPDSDPRATQRGVASGRIAACWFASSSFNVDLNLTDQATHRVAFYLLDWDNISRVTQIDVLDATTQQVLSTRTVSGYSQGTYMTWDLSGHVIVRFTTVGGQNAVLSAVFFDAVTMTGSASPWNTYGHDAQHTALSNLASQPLTRVRWQTPMDLQPQYTGTSLLIHYGSPLVTTANTVIVPVKTGATDGFRVEARSGSDGGLKWSMTTDYTLPAHDWIPVFGPALTSNPRLYFPGAGGTVYFRDQPDASQGSSGQIAFYGLANYQANPQAYNSAVMINTPITTDPSGNVYFGFRVTGSTPLGLTSGIARVSASGQGSWTPVTTAAADPLMTGVPHNSAPALSADLSMLYVAVSDGNAGYLVALDSTSLAPMARIRLRDPVSGQDSWLSDNGSATPTLGPDGEVYFGVLDNPHGSNHFRGWLLHFDQTLSQSKIPGAFGWDDTTSIVPAAIVPSYQGTSPYLLMVKYNNYNGAGGDGLNKVAVLDPRATQTDSATNAVVMKEVLTILSPTPNPEGGFEEWCINSAAVDAPGRSILVNNEDGKLYRWDLATNTLSQSVVLTSGLGEAYTSTVIGVDGSVYAISNATLFNVGQ